MKMNRMKKELMVLGIIFTLFFLTTDAFSWSAATHAYIEDHLGKKRGLDNSNEIYGGIVPDVFNYLFNYPAYLDYLYGQTHNEFLRCGTHRDGGFKGHPPTGLLATTMFGEQILRLITFARHAAQKRDT